MDCSWPFTKGDDRCQHETPVCDVQRIDAGSADHVQASGQWYVSGPRDERRQDVALPSNLSQLNGYPYLSRDARIDRNSQRAFPRGGEQKFSLDQDCLVAADRSESAGRKFDVSVAMAKAAHRHFEDVDRGLKVRQRYSKRSSAPGSQERLLEEAQQRAGWASVKLVKTLQQLGDPAAEVLIRIMKEKVDAVMIERAADAFKTAPR